MRDFPWPKVPQESTRNPENPCSARLVASRRSAGSRVASGRLLATDPAADRGESPWDVFGNPLGILMGALGGPD